MIFPSLADDFQLITCDVIGTVVDVGTLVLVVTVDTEIVDINVPSPLVVDSRFNERTLENGQGTSNWSLNNVSKLSVSPVIVK